LPVRKVDRIQIAFSSGANDFSGVVMSRTVSVSENVAPGDQEISQVLGLGSVSTVAERQTAITNAAVDGSLQSQTSKVALQEAISQTTISRSANTWVLLRLPKSSFVGGAESDWAAVQAARLTIKTKKDAGVIAYWDDLKIAGGFGLQGRYRYRVTFRNTSTGSRSNANPNYVEVTNVGRQSVVLNSLPLSSDSQVDQREIWRTVGDGILYFRCGTVDDNTTTTF